jgi:predicted deacylase
MEKEAFPPPGPDTTLGFGMSNNIPTIIIESNDWRHFNKKTVDMSVRGLVNALKHIGMIEGEIEKQPPEAKTARGLFEGVTVTSDYGGMVYMEKEPGSKVYEGELVARVLDLYGDEVGQACSPRSGYLIGYFLFYGQAVAQGDDIFYVASEFSREEIERLVA